MPFNYENKRLAQHWTTHNWHDSKYAYVPKADILNICDKLIRVDKNSNKLVNIYCI